MKLIKALLHLYSKQGLGKLNYKSFIRQTSNVCILFHHFNIRLIFSPTMCLHLSFLEGRVRGRHVTQSHFSCPWQPMAFANLSPLHLSSPLLHFTLPPSFISGGLLPLLSPLPLSLQTQPRYPCQIHWRQPGEVNMEPIDSLLSLWNSWGREGKHGWNSRTAQNNCNNSF